MTEPTRSAENAPDVAGGARLIGSMSGATYAGMRGRFVLYLWRRGADVLYVGLSGSIFSRLGSHNHIGRSEQVQDEDVIELYDVPQEWFAAAAIEEALIERLGPRYNRQVRFGQMIQRVKGRELG